MGVFDEEIQVAKELIAEFGEDITLRRFTAAADPDPNKPWESGDITPDDQSPVKAVFLDYNSRYVDGTVIKRGDQQVYIAADGLTNAPEVGGQILRGSDKWNIVNVETLSPNEQVIMFTLQVRK